MTARAFISLCLVATVALAMPQYGQQQQQANTGKQLQAQPMMPMNYDFQWEVNNEEYQNYYGHQEAAVNGRVDGSYHVWLPDGRLMRVEYYVDGDSGFVPTITYEDGYAPNWGTSYFNRR
ncbi:pro-resilin-like [Penaeus monodon]|uniref:pro-resilin-like n=1 Tax=Penaeus monodon TaxID=6687 RepID=UPI0018A7DB16|nr:pro-resilin-like [Penaeus monodon]